jgi:hypothetical protein
MRTAYRTGGFDRPYVGEDFLGVPVAVFSNHADALTCRDQFQTEAESQVDPFHFECDSSAVYENLRVVIERLGLAAPQTQSQKGREFTNWRGWWEENVATLTESQRVQIIAALRLPAFYRVVETTMEF